MTIHIAERNFFRYINKEFYPIIFDYIIYQYTELYLISADKIMCFYSEGTGFFDNADDPDHMLNAMDIVKEIEILDQPLQEHTYRILKNEYSK